MDCDIKFDYDRVIIEPCATPHCLPFCYNEKPLGYFASFSHSDAFSAIVIMMTDIYYTVCCSQWYYFPKIPLSVGWILNPSIVKFRIRPALRVSPYRLHCRRRSARRLCVFACVIMLHTTQLQAYIFQVYVHRKPFKGGASPKPRWSQYLVIPIKLLLV